MVPLVVLLLVSIRHLDLALFFLCIIAGWKRKERTVFPVWLHSGPMSFWWGVLTPDVVVFGSGYPELPQSMQSCPFSVTLTATNPSFGPAYRLLLLDVENLTAVVEIWGSMARVRGL